MIDENIHEIIKEYNNGESASKLAKKYNVSTWLILKRLRKNNITIRSSKTQNEKYLNLSKRDKKLFVETIDGLLLGDGNIHSKNYLQISQNGKNIPWLNQINKLFLDIGCVCKFTEIKPRIRFINDRKIISKNGRLLRTLSYVEFQNQRKRWYPEKSKKIPLDVKITPLSVALWFCGDGTSDQKGYLTFCTNSFSYEETSLLKEKMRINLNVDLSIYKNNRNEYIMRSIRLDDSFKLKQQIEEHIPECFKYKLAGIRKPKHNVKLTNEQVLEVRKLSDKYSTVELSAKFNVSKVSIYNIVNRKTYKSL